MLNVVAHIKQLKKLKKEVWKTSLTPQYMTFRGMEDRSEKNGAATFVKLTLSTMTLSVETLSIEYIFDKRHYDVAQTLTCGTRHK